MDHRSMKYLSQSKHQTELLIQWCEKLVLDAGRKHIIAVDPPLLARIFQEFSLSATALSKVRNIKEVQFPFPYAQMIAAMLAMHWLVTPFLATQMVQSLICFFLTGSLWSLVYIAREIDQPFGDDANDLRVKEIMIEFNTTLLGLLDPINHTPPSYTCQGIYQESFWVVEQNKRALQLLGSGNREQFSCSRAEALVSSRYCRYSEQRA
eukprot:TRINITY_DN78683_c0_g1_i1.p1 TRINITY_DN78683_c0_g1~~TRINITY_DN78683_c0_g1_i1.p1  ORF type:complete len:223 (+),score=35.85 TRINITY_DN78683_c0_g1_i1:47-670(+)